jgi:DNA helicase HerA-like ATPase
MAKTITNNSIGKVTASEKNPTSCNKLQFWVRSDVIIRPFDIVRIQHISRSSNQISFTYAIVQDLTYITDSAGHLSNYISSDFGNVDSIPFNKRLGTTIADAEVLYNTEDIEMPLHDGAIVEWADEDGIKEALGLNAYHNPIPAGYMSMSNGLNVPIDLEADYLVGPEGAHLNIAGISGLATKTSYAMFLLNAIQQKYNHNVTMIIFNVKGKDLLSIDTPAKILDAEITNSWEKCGLSPTPFQRVKYLYPYSFKDKDFFTLSHAKREILDEQIIKGIAHNYYYDFCDIQEKIYLLFSDIDDPNSTMESIFYDLNSQDFNSWDELFKLVSNRSKSGGTDKKEISVQSWRKFNRILKSRVESHQDDLFREKDSLNAEKKRQKTIKESILDLNPGDVLVIDIEPLPDYLQCLVVGDVIKTIYQIKLGDIEDISPDKLKKTIIFADELNKYAPKGIGSKRTLTNDLLEITERGRSLGTVLFGAEQFRSGVHDQILGNCSTNVYGRTSPVEIGKCHDYRYFPSSYQSTATRLVKGSLLLQHAVFKTALVKVNFPRPCYYQPED